MTYPDTHGHDPSVPAGGTDTSDEFGPYISGSGTTPAPLKGYPGYDTTSATYPPGPSSAGINVPRAVFHTGTGYAVHGDLTADSSNGPPTADRDGDDGLPDVPRYEGPDVPLQAPLINPSAGNQGPVESGMTDINPQGSPNPMPGAVPIETYDQAPGNTSKGNPSY